MAVREKKLRSRSLLTTRKQRKAVWLEAAKQIARRYKVDERDAKMVAALYVDWLRNQSGLASS